MAMMKNHNEGLKKPVRIVSRFLTTFSLMSRIPITTEFAADFSRSDFWIPAMSPFVSLAAIGGFASAMFLTGNFMLATTAAIATQYFLFNLFHLDGLVDTADAILPAASRERRMEILKDPRVGTYGLFSGFLVLAGRFGAYDLLARQGILFSVLVVGLLTSPLAGRTAAALLAAIWKPARSDGLGSLMTGFKTWKILLGFLAGSIPLAIWALVEGTWILALIGILAALGTSLITAFCVGKIYSKTLGGFTGDSLGAAIEIGELLSLIVLGIAINLFGGLPL